MGAALKIAIQQNTSADNWSTYMLAIFGGMGGGDCAAIDPEVRKRLSNPRLGQTVSSAGGAAGGADRGARKTHLQTTLSGLDIYMRSWPDADQSKVVLHRIDGAYVRQD